MTDPYNILFLCTGNSARSIVAECLLNRMGDGRFRAYSAGSMPAGKVHPQALALLNSLGHETGALRSKSWDEFSADRADAPQMHFVFTVCDRAGAEVCPVWPGQPVNAHWGLPDPAAATGSEAEIRLAFAAAYRALERRIEAFISLPIESLNRLSLTSRLREIGQL
ncbi:arsenate reductase ArsC [Hyphobacterium sp. HN65]|uniref:Arsenate reductase ArsC n=1 Tax=Hyphobacterium lacteum TaxID=3116575 RepID=A0ABU7LTR0_9PROT|nr:arsenate reductase ArsC [Hyphobacterium sp. HN65]MEE2527307.1 arsenate reductase ArsC [Hyphobacterium sp. HN65]